MNNKYIFRKKDGREQVLTIRRCRPDEAGAIMEMQKRVMERIMDSRLYVVTTMEDIMESLELDLCMGAYDGDQIVGFSILLNLRDTPRNLACHLEYPLEYCLKCTTCDGTWVDPAYRGYGIQYFFSRGKDQAAARMGAEELLACTSPMNHASLASLRKNGYRVVRQKELYGGYDRYILRKDAMALKMAE